MARGAKSPNPGNLRERTLEDAERDRDVATWKLTHPNATYQEVADHFGVSKSTAWEAVHRCLTAAIRPVGQEVLAAELLKLDAQEAAAWEILRAHNVYVADGRVVKDEGVTIDDPRPVLWAIDRLLKISDRRSRFLGLDAPARSEVTVVSRDAVEQAIAELEAQLADNDPCDPAPVQG